MTYLLTPDLDGRIGGKGLLGIDGRGFIEETYFLHIYAG
jgi:hypothetical protein